MKTKLSMAKKIWLSLSILMLGYFISMMFGFILSRESEYRLIHVSNVLFPASTLGEQALTAFKEQIRLYNDSVMFGDKELINKAGQKAKDIQQALSKIADMAGLELKVRESVRDVNLAVKEFTAEAQNAYMALAAGNAGNAENAKQLTAKTANLQDQLQPLSKALADGLKQELMANVHASKRQRFLSMGFFFTVVILSIFLITIIITRSITRPIHRIILGLSDGSSQVGASSGQVAKASQSLAEGASQQAASLEESSSSLEEISSMTKQNADNANQANILMAEARNVVGAANDSMAKLTESMKEIAKASEETSKIIKTIDEIAFQTNLLALNAAVEAARAGDVGAGFAVVANEVRNLAMRASDAARNTANLIEATVKKVKDGSDLVNRTNDAFEQVTASAGKVSQLVSEIAASSNEQAQGIEQINKAVTELDKVTQQNAANAEESASASEEMNAQAEQMKGMVDELVTMVGGSTGGSNRVQAHSVKVKKLQTARRELGTSHHALVSRQATVKLVAATRKRNPEEVIPMEENFKDR